MDNSTGRLGEDYASELFQNNGFTLLENNYRTRLGEVDIIAENKTYIVFVEVKTRKTGGMTHPAESVTEKKQKRIINAASQYLADHPTQLQPRFDVVAVFTKNGKVIGHDWLENAYWL